MQHKKVRKQPLNLGRLETTILDVHGSHLPRHHDLSRVTLLGDVRLRRQPKNLSKLNYFTWNLLPLVIHIKILSFLS
jgi:hypothetical protein